MSFYDYFKMNEKKMSIQRFSGENEMSDSELLKFLHNIKSLTNNGEIDLSLNDKINMTEKFDSSKADFGIKDNFFMASSNNVVTSDNLEKYNNPYMIDFYESFKFLDSYEPFQEKLKKANAYAGTSVKYISEMFPVLTHTGDNIGDIIFVASRYSKEKFGNKGAFMVFDVKVLEGETWVDPSDEIKDVLIDIIRDVKDTEWKTYYVEYDGKLSGNIKIDVSGIDEWINDPQKLDASIALLKKKNDPKKDELKNILTKIRPQLQSQLDAYAEKTKSSMGNTEGNYPIEGVVLRVNLPDGPTFIKGTSKIFHDIKKNTWGTRVDVSKLEDTLDGNFIKDVLGLPSDNPRLLNNAIKDLLTTFKSDKGGDEKTNEFAFQLFKKLSTTTNEDEARKKAANYINVARKELHNIVSTFESNKTNMDPDSIRKTESQIKFFNDKLNSLESRVVDTQYKGDAYFVYLLRLLLGRRIDTYLNTNNVLDELKAIPKTLKQISAETGKSLKFMQAQLKRGIEVEMEHTDDIEESKTIAMQHLAEDPEYYIKLDSLGLEELDMSKLVKWLNTDLDGVKNPTDDDLIDQGTSTHPVKSAAHDLDDNLINHALIDLDPGNKELWNKAIQYIQGKHDEDPETWNEECEEFDETEVLDERRYEKVKMARSLLSRLGHTKSFSRNEKGKYILRSKDIKKIMASLGYEFNEVKGRWIMQPIEKEKGGEGDTNNSPFVAQKVKPTIEKPASNNNAIIWIGRAQPWHKGHDALIKESISKLKEVGANFVLIMLVKGAKTSTDTSENPLNFDEQRELITSVYKDNPEVKVSTTPLPSGFIADIMINAANQGIIIKGWLCGSDREATYKNQYQSFISDKYKDVFQSKTSPETKYPIDGEVKFIVVNRTEDEKPAGRLTKKDKEAASAAKTQKSQEVSSAVNNSDTSVISVEKMSGSLARSLVQSTDFMHWFKEVCPADKLSNNNVREAYNSIYNILKYRLSPSKELTENLKNILSGIYLGD